MPSRGQKDFRDRVGFAMGRLDEMVCKIERVAKSKVSFFPFFSEDAI